MSLINAVVFTIRSQELPL